MSYEFHTLYSTDTAFNCDITKSDEDKYMGRLYILATEDPELLKLGIEKEWFLAHESGDFFICGHINIEGQWSLSSYKSLEPSLAYTTQSEILDYVFSPEYVSAILQLRHDQALDLSESVVFKSDSFSDDNNFSDGSKPAKIDTSLLHDFSTSIPNLDVLRDLLLRSSPEELQEANLQQNETSSFEQVESAIPIVPLEVLISVGEKTTKLEKTEVLEIQKALIDKIIDEYSEDISEFILPPFGKVTIHVEEDYFVLCSSEDGHTILAATLDGSVLDELKDNDALKFTDVLHSSEVEVSRYFENSLEKQIETIVTVETHNAAVEQQKGIDYGA